MRSVLRCSAGVGTLACLVIVLIAPASPALGQNQDDEDVGGEAAQIEPESEAEEEHAAEEEHEAGAEAIFDWRTDLALWTLVVFILLVLVLGKWAWRPIVQALDAREQRIRKDIEDAAAQNRRAQELLAEHQKQLDHVQDEVRAIIDEARRDATHTAQEIVRKAQEDAQATQARSIREIERARDQALKEIFERSADYVLQASSEVIGRSLNDAEHRRLVEEALAEFKPNGSER